MRRDRTLVTSGRDLPPTHGRGRVDDQFILPIFAIALLASRGLTPSSGARKAGCLPFVAGHTVLNNLGTLLDAGVPGDKE
jgi:hypothetical protein